MKKLIASFLIFISLFAAAQKSKKEAADAIVIGKVKKSTNLIAELSYKVDGRDTLYTLKYKDAQTRGTGFYNYVRFTEKWVLDTLYSHISGVFSAEHKKDRDYKRTLRLDDNEVSVRPYHMMGATSAIVYSAGGYFYITSEQVDKLFAKKVE